MSEQNLRSTYPKGPAIRVDDGRPTTRADDATYQPEPAPRAVHDPASTSQGYPGVELDKTLRHVRLPGDLGPDKTPGGHGQVWRRQDKPLE